MNKNFDNNENEQYSSDSLDVINNVDENATDIESSIDTEQDEYINSHIHSSELDNTEEDNIKNDVSENETINLDEDNNDFENSGENTNKKKVYTYRKSIAVCLAGALLCGGSLGYCLGLGLNTSKEIINSITGGFSFSSNESTDATPTASNLVASEESIAKVVDSVKNSVVNISVKVESSADWFGQTYESEGSGSGIIYKVDGDTVYIVTNNHVVDDANAVTVSISGKEQVKAKLVGKDASSELAVISISKADLNSAGITDVSPAKFGNSDDMKVGENVIPIGNALGQGKTATLGIISAQNKEINIDGKKLTVIQTDAAINPGNSGGALVNTAGEVIGINTAKLSNSAVEGIGYAIPISAAQPIINTLMENGTVDKPYLGISGYTIDENFSMIYGINIPGVFISNIEENSAAESAGLQISDIITAIDGTETKTVDALADEISKHKSGDTIKLSVVRNGNQSITISATLQNQNEQF